MHRRLGSGLCRGWLSSKKATSVSQGKTPLGQYSCKPQHTAHQAKKCYLYAEADWDSLRKHCDPIAEDVTRKPGEGTKTEDLWTTLLANAIDKRIPDKVRTNRHAQSAMKGHRPQAIATEEETTPYNGLPTDSTRKNDGAR